MEIIYCNNLPDSPLGHLAIFNGATNKTKNDFLNNIWKQLDFPYPEYKNWDGYLDWITDLDWIKDKNISIVITNFDLFLSESQEYRKYFIEDFEQKIFPFWKHHAIEVFCDENRIKDINVYCVKCKMPKENQISTEKAIEYIHHGALNGMKAPHSTSMPVLRMHEGKLCFAAFVFFYNREELQSAIVQRPSWWIVSDLKTGEIVQRYSCQDNEFSNEKYDKLYDISTEKLPELDNVYWNTLYTIMDLIIDEYMNFGTLNKNLYKYYLDKIYDATPGEYKVFYKDLSNIEL